MPYTGRQSRCTWYSRPPRRPFSWFMPVTAARRACAARPDFLARPGSDRRRLETELIVHDDLALVVKQQKVFAERVRLTAPRRDHSPAAPATPLITVGVILRFHPQAPARL